jgi:phospholipase/carboxylesterase
MSCNKHLISVPPRRGSPPATSRVIPHLQLDQFTSTEMVSKLIAQCLQLEQVRRKESRMAAPSTAALWIPDDFAMGPADAFIDDHEFCHIHEAPQGSLHLTLPREIRESIVRLGWGEPHAMVALGSISESTSLVYAPRDEDELQIVTAVVEASYRFARGLDLCRR